MTLYRDIVEAQLVDWKECGGSLDTETVHVSNELYINPDGCVERLLDGLDTTSYIDEDFFDFDDEALTVLGIE